MSACAERLPGEVIGRLVGLDPADVPAVVHGGHRAEQLLFRPLPEDEQIAAAEDVVAMQHIRYDSPLRGFGRVATGRSPWPAPNSAPEGRLRRLRWRRPRRCPVLVPRRVRHPRAPVRHLAFGLGAHGCPGAQLVPQQATFAPSRCRHMLAPHRPKAQVPSTRPSGRHTESAHRTPLLHGQTSPAEALAREQLRIALTELTRRLPGLRLADGRPVALRPTLIHGAPQHLQLASWARRADVRGGTPCPAEPSPAPATGAR